MNMNEERDSVSIYLFFWNTFHWNQKFFVFIHIFSYILYCFYDFVAFLLLFLFVFLTYVYSVHHFQNLDHRRLLFLFTLTYSLYIHVPLFCIHLKSQLNFNIPLSFPSIIIWHCIQIELFVMFHLFQAISNPHAFLICKLKLYCLS